MKFKKNDKVIGTHPALGGTFKGVVLFDDLIGRAPVLVKFDVNGDELCVQVDAEGGGILRHDDTPASVRCVSYLFSDGTATAFKPADEPRSFSRVTIGAMTADRLADGTYTGHKFRSFVDDDAESDDDMQGSSMIEIPLDGSAMRSLDGRPIPDNVKDILDKLFGKK